MSVADLALKVISVKVKHYAGLMNVQYGRITIRNQKTRWGSCSSKGNLNFNCLLMLAPDEVVEFLRIFWRGKDEIHNIKNIRIVIKDNESHNNMVSVVRFFCLLIENGALRTKKR